MGHAAESGSIMANPVHHDAGTEAGEGLKAWRLYLRTCIENAASDLHIKSDAPPKIRIRGELRKMAAPNCTKDLMFQIAKDVLDESQYEMFSQKVRLTSRMTTNPRTRTMMWFAASG